MSNFVDFRNAVEKQFNRMSQLPLFKTGVTKDDLWNTYLGSFTPEDNPMFRERTEHDCQCCKSFIRAMGAVVCVNNENQLESIWDVDVDSVYQPVADALAELVKAEPISTVFLTTEKAHGQKTSIESPEITWSHFFCNVPTENQCRADSIGTVLGDKNTNAQVLKRGLTELTTSALKSVIELIDQNSLYRGEEFRSSVARFLDLKLKMLEETSNSIQLENFCWKQSVITCGLCKFRNSAIGTLVTDISDGMGLDAAVGSFEAKVAPTNYKRPTALITKGMIKEAEKTLIELGIEPSLSRRHAVVDDITINNVLFADRSAKKSMGIMDELMAETKDTIKNLDKVEEVTADDFIEKILPKASKVELLLDNKHASNFMTLVAPENTDAPNILKWGNNFSWSYAGNVADSMKERVRKAGGNVEGVLRFSLMWNDGDNNQNDFDAHCIEPGGNTIYFGRKRNSHTSGVLDVDITRPGNKPAVENITWSNVNKMEDGRYKVLVHNYSHNGGTTGFSAEIECDGVIHSFSYDKGLRQNEKVVVAEFTWSKAEGLKFITSLPGDSVAKDIWGLTTNAFRNVSMVMKSPNHWDGEETGNRHMFFILDGCENPERPRGFYNEFLKNDLTKHRKVFEVLASKMMVPASDRQLSGLGFSSTKRDSVLCRISGSFNRVVKIKF